jgi:hypothetical protein
VDIVFCLHGQVEIDDVRNRWHVNTARGDVRRNHNLNSPFEQHPHDPVTGMLRQIAMQGCDCMTCVAQTTSLIFSRQLGRHKNDGLLHASRRQHGVQQAILMVEIVGVVDHLGQKGTVDPL